MDGKSSVLRAPENSSNNLFDLNVYRASGGSNNTLEQKFSKIAELESKYPTETLNRLATHITKIFVHPEYETTEENQRKAKIQAITNFNVDYGNTIFDIGDLTDTSINKAWNIINADSGAKFTRTIAHSDGTKKTYSSNIKADVNTYYEYVQFKRGIFKCADYGSDKAIEYDSNTGRVTGMTFVFTGELN